MNPHHTCIVIVGPTAVGKTAFAIELAKKLQTQIISADSRQCYRELNIGVGKPSPAQLSGVRHHFINSHSVQQEVHAAMFERYSLEAVAEIFTTNKYAILTGGTGLYVDAFCNGMDDVPLIKPEIRDNIIASYKEHGLNWLREQVSALDPEYFLTGETQNPQRLMRALEVKLSTGNSIKSFQKSIKRKRDFSIIKIGLELPRGVLYNQINTRVNQMVEDGLEDEVRSLVPFKHLNALNTVGYKEIFEYLEGKHDLAQAIELVKKHSRHYAKRQLTWFKKDEQTRWIHPADNNALIDLLKL